MNLPENVKLAMEIIAHNRNPFNGLTREEMTLLGFPSKHTANWPYIVERSGVILVEFIRTLV